MTKLRAGVIGLGMGRHHARQLGKHPRVELAALADIDEDRLTAAGDELLVSKLYTDPGEMIQAGGLDLVIVATPNTFHKPLTVAALAKGAHVLCEKPMAMNAGEAREMLAASREADRRLMINFSFRFNPHSQALKREA